jgi:hypothetical protein
VFFHKFGVDFEKKGKTDNGLKIEMFDFNFRDHYQIHQVINTRVFFLNNVSCEIMFNNE